MRLGSAQQSIATVRRKNEQVSPFGPVANLDQNRQAGIADAQAAADSGLSTGGRQHDAPSFSRQDRPSLEPR